MRRRGVRNHAASHGGRRSRAIARSAPCARDHERARPPNVRSAQSGRHRFVRSLRRARRAQTRRPALCASGSPPESSTSIFQRRSSACTRRAIDRSGVISAAVASGVSSDSRRRMAIASASACLVGSLDQRNAAERGGDLRAMGVAIEPPVGRRTLPAPAPARGNACALRARPSGRRGDARRRGCIRARA